MHIILSTILFYVAGFLLSYSMLKIEHVSEKNVFTKGDVVIGGAMSVLSWVMVFIILVNAWFKQIKITGYWNKPAKDKHEA